jgi:hypothetical protein
MMTTTTYPPLPELDARQPDETAEHYGLRALRFAVATDCIATMPDDALQLAAHCYRLAIARADLLQTTIDRLAETERQIQKAIRRRQDAAQMTTDTPADGAPAGRDKPNAGPGAPLAPPTRSNPPAPRLATVGATTRQDFSF